MSAPSNNQQPHDEQQRDSSSQPLRHGQNRYSQRETGFGDRLSEARAQRPDLVVAASPAPSSVAEGGLPLDQRFHSALRFDTTTQDHVAHPSHKPIYDGIKGSYVSPYDSGGKTPGNPRLLSWTTPDKAYHRSAAPSQLTPSSLSVESVASVKSTNTITPFSGRGKQSMQLVQSAPAEKRVVQAPTGATRRVLLLGPYKVMRAACLRQAKDLEVMGQLKDWLDQYMHPDLHTPDEIEDIIPWCVTRVVLPMTDEHWASYHEALKFFPEAVEMHTILSNGKSAFDQVTAGYRDKKGNIVYPEMDLKGQTLEEMLAGYVKGYRLGIPWDWARPHNRPDTLPQEYGGQMEDYVS